MRVRPRVSVLRSAALAVAVACACWSIGGVSAHGELDQFLEGDAGCNAFNYPAAAPLASTPRQSFVPSGSLVSSIGICVEAAAPATISIAVRMGTPGAPGAVVGALSVDVPAGASFAHADFLAALPVSAGGRYVIEAIGDGAVDWRGTAEGVELYTAGTTNAGAGDLAFRSYLAPEPATATRTATPQATRTRTRTPTPPPTLTRTPSPVPPASGVPTSTPEPAVASPTLLAVLPATMSPGVTANPSATRTATALPGGSIRSAALITGPDVGDGPQSSGGDSFATRVAVALTLSAPLLAVWFLRRRLG